MKHQIPITNNQIIIKTPMTKIPKKQNFLVIGDWILFGPALAGLEFGNWNLTLRVIGDTFFIRQLNFPLNSQ